MRYFGKLIFAFALLPLVSCADMLDVAPSDQIASANMWTTESLADKGMAGLYDNFYRDDLSRIQLRHNDMTGINRQGWMGMEFQTDFVSDNYHLRALSDATKDATEFVVWYEWKWAYTSIHQINDALENLHKAGLSTEKYERYICEARFLRAWFYWDLLQKFGGKGTDGQLLGVPLILEPVKIWELDPEEIRNIDIKRATYEECVQQIISDCDEAIKYLPKAHRDFLVEDPLDLRILGSRCYGRLDGITMTAVKALVYLTWASPRFNPEGDQTRWENAAKFAKEVIDFKLEVDGAVSNGFAVDKSVNFFNPNDPSIIFASRYNNNNEDMERMFYPDGMQGNGNMGATQELVDAFGMADGYPLGDPRSQYEYDPENPYENRDPRFYSVIFYNGRTISTGAAGDKLYTFENYVGGKDEAERSSRNSLTNYHIKKFVYSGLNWSESSVAKMPHCKFFIRWDHMVLAFAEAANQIGGPNHQIDGLTPKQAISWLRSRPTYDGDPGLVSDPYLDEISLAGKDAFNEFLKNERRIETCFEGTWFFDIRRWSTTLGDLNKPVHRPVITREADGSYTYDYEVIEERTFRSAYLPIPYKEMLNINGLVQNEGWESWQ